MKEIQTTKVKTSKDVFKNSISIERKYVSRKVRSTKNSVCVFQAVLVIGAK